MHEYSIQTEFLIARICRESQILVLPTLMQLFPLILIISLFNRVKSAFNEFVSNITPHSSKTYSIFLYSFLIFLFTQPIRNIINIIIPKTLASKIFFNWIDPCSDCWFLPYPCAFFPWDDPSTRACMQSDTKVVTLFFNKNSFFSAKPWCSYFFHDFSLKMFLEGS